MKSGFVDPYFIFSVADAGALGGVVDCWYNLALTSSKGIFHRWDGIGEASPTRRGRKGELNVGKGDQLTSAI